MSATAIPVSAFGGAAGGALVWRARGELHLGAMVKVELALAHDAVATIAVAGELALVDRPPGAMQPLELPSDYSPPLPKPEVLLVGHACAPGERAVPSMSVRLFVGREEQALIDKTVHVYGDRSNGKSLPQPFVRMPLEWALAVGGPNTDNPAGRALNDPVAPPNVVDPHSPWASAGFAPIAAGWPLRRRAAPSALPRLVSGVLELPADLSMEHFQCAPPDQRVAALAGDEWIVIDGMHAERTRFQSQLPSLRARARLARGGLGEPMPFALTLDRLFIDMQRWTAQLTWRGSMRVEPAELMDAQVVVGVESPEDQPMELSSETMMLSQAQLDNAMEGQALPWELEPPPPPKSGAGRAFGGLPFRPPASAAPLPSPSAPTVVPVAPTFGPPPVEIVNESTITNVDEQVVAALPFGKSSRFTAGFDVPRALEDDDDDDAGETKVAPIRSGADAALPFSARKPAPPAVVSGAPTMSEKPSLITMPVLPVIPSTSGRTIQAPPLVRMNTGAGPITGPSALPEGVVRVATPAAVQQGIAEPVTEEPATDPEPRPMAGPSALLGSGGVSLGAVAPAPEAIVEDPPTEEPSAAESSVAESSAAEPPPASPEETLRQLLLDNIRNDIAMFDMDLTGADLAGMDLRGAILGGAKLTGAKLAGTMLREARLSNAKLIGADLRGADLWGADLTGADLSRADLTGAKLDNATLTAANLASVKADGASFFRIAGERGQFVQAKLEAASFELAALRDADFSGSIIGKACFRGAKAAAATFTDARGEGTIFDDAEIQNAAFGGAALPDLSCIGAQAERSNWERAELDRAAFDRANLSNATLVRASMGVASFLAANLVKADLSSVTGDGADFSEADLTGVDLRMSKLSDARFVNAKLVDSNGQKVFASGARMEGADLSRASFRGARMKSCQLTNAKLEATDLRDADLEGAKLDGVDTSKAKLAGANMRGVTGLPT
jgi:uncharacterized protein YjbI with pentapeptide repeats